MLCSISISDAEDEQKVETLPQFLFVWERGAEDVEVEVLSNGKR